MGSIPLKCRLPGANDLFLFHGNDHITFNSTPLRATFDVISIKTLLIIRREHLIFSTVPAYRGGNEKPAKEEWTKSTPTFRTIRKRLSLCVCVKPLRTDPTHPTFGAFGRNSQVCTSHIRHLQPPSNETSEMKKMMINPLLIYIPHN